MAFTAENWITHAQKFGSEGVMQSAAGLFDFATLVRIQIACDDGDRKLARGRFGYTKPRLTAETRVKRLLGLDDTLD